MTDFIVKKNYDTKYTWPTNQLVFIPLDGNILTDTLSIFMEIMVGKLMREEPMNSIDFLIITVLLTIVIYLFSYIRRNK